MIIDMQYGSVDPDHELGRYYEQRMPEVGRRYYQRVRETVVPNQKLLLEFFRSRRLRVIHLMVGSLMPDGSDLMPLLRSRDRMIQEATGQPQSSWHRSPSRQIIPEVAPLDDELLVVKSAKGAFNSSSIDQILRNLGITSLVMGGVATNACVETTARDAADRGYQCMLIEDACASNSSELHDATLINFQHLFGQVRTTAEAVTALAAWDGGEDAIVATDQIRPDEGAHRQVATVTVD